MIRLRFTLLTLMLVVGAMGTPSAFAQSRYTPTRGPISPWMDMFQRHPGPLDNYHSYVKPEMQAQNQFNQQQNALAQNAAGVQVLGQQMADAKKESQVNPTGTGSVFMDYSHYYPAKGGRAATRPHAQSRGAAPSSGTRMMR